MAVTDRVGPLAGGSGPIAVRALYEVTPATD